MKTSVALTLSVLLCTTSLGKEIKNGETIEVKANSIWFQDAGMLSKWQELKKSGDKVALKSYEEKTLGARDAWQFLKRLTVKVLGYDAAKNQAHVTMLTEGRMKGTDWWIDASALGK